MPLTDPQISLIQSSLPALREHGGTITSTFYSSLLSENPSLKNTFNLTHQRTASQPLALASVLAAYAEHITAPAALGPAVASINHRHASLGVTPAQYDVVGTYLLRAMSEVLGAALTPDLKAAWAAAYTDLAGMMIKAETDLYAHAQKETWAQGSEGDFRTCKLVSRNEEGEGVVSLRFWPVGWEGRTLPLYKPGQYVSVKVWIEDEGLEQIRQYTLSDSPGRAQKEGYRITPKKIGMVSGALHGLKVGDEVEVSFPRGVFFFEKEQELVQGGGEGPVVLVSAGIGVTPMVSILTSLLPGEQVGERKISWIHSHRSAPVLPFKNLVDGLRSQHPGLRSKVFVTGPVKDEKLGETVEGRITLDKLDKEQDLYVDDERTLYFLCGPAAFMESMGKGLKLLGVPESRIKAEVFGVGSPSI
ncbi:Oxidoreductase NAD-binding domain-containing protein 4 [Elsinoe fawcettii]|nr:Oxidoreductase NAD-binding domain-containing protein 4 [Elsinoe fawcettii]